MSELAGHVRKGKNARAQKAIERKLPKNEENAKRLLVLEGGKTSGMIKSVLTELYMLKKGQAVRFTRKNDQVRPFESGGEVSLEFVAQKSDCSLFAFGSHSKKRPHNLVLGRMYDFHMYDMVELGVESFKSLKEFGSAATGAAMGMKPCMVFSGEGFETSPELKLLKSILLDMFRGDVVQRISLKGLDRVIVVAAAGGVVYWRQCVIKFKKSGTRVPRVVLEEMGPSLSFSVRRHRLPSAELAKEAMRQPAKAKKIKNVKEDEFGETYGRVYLPSQDVDEIALRKMKGLKREKRDAKEDKQDGAKKKRKVAPENDMTVEDVDDDDA